MLEIRPNCEHCNKDLPYNSIEAMICSFECTYCKNCAENIFKNVCPNCGGNFEKRPIRPIKELQKNPVSKKRIYNPKDIAKFKKGYLLEYKNIFPENR